MSSYYYALASLPMLSLNDTSGVEMESFDEICREQLSDSDYQALMSARLDNYTEENADNPLFLLFRKWETALRNVLTRMRGQQRGVEYEKYQLPGDDITGMEDLAKEAMNNPSPYEAALRLYSARWDYLEELGINQFFNLEALTVYYLKLQILAKLRDYNKDRGSEALTKHYKKIRAAADEGTAADNEN